MVAKSFQISMNFQDVLFLGGGRDLFAIERRVPSELRIVVDTEDAGNFACNAVNVGQELFVHKASDPLKTRLKRIGFAVHEIELSEFLKSGGSAKCLTLRLTEPLRA